MHMLMVALIGNCFGGGGGGGGGVARINVDNDVCRYTALLGREVLKA